MIRTRLYIGVILAFLLWSCSSDGGDFTDLPFNSDGLITPTCLIYTPLLEAGTRGYGVKGDKDTITSRLFRADQNSSSVWPTTSSGLPDKSVSVTNSGQVVFPFDKEWYYQVNGKYTKLLGLYPYTTTPVTIGNQITYALDGSTDLMATAWSNAANKWSTAIDQPKLTFNHLLTQLIISVVAEESAAIDAWGNINSVTIEGMKNSCTLTLPIPTNTSKPFIAGSSGSTSFTVRDINGKTIPSKVMTTNEVVYGYCMIVPGKFTSSSPLKLTIRTVKHPTGQAVSLPGSGVSTTYTFETGKAYTVRLKMTKVDILPSVSISSWTESDVNLGGEAGLGDWGNGGSIGNGNVVL